MASPVSESIVDFSAAFHQTLVSQDPQGNIFFSPWSIATAFAIVFAGCKGKTADEIAEVFRWSLRGDADLNRLFGELQKALESHSNPATHLSLANKLWVNKGFGVHKDFTDILRSQFESEIGFADFKANVEEARKRINSWVGDHTGQKIKDLFPEGSLEDTTRLVIANAVYFKGTWKKPFDKEVTRSDDFFLADGKSVKVDMMYTNQMLKVTFDKKAECTVVELPYLFDMYSMVVVVPDDVPGVSTLEKQISAKKMNQWISKLRPMSVDFFMPKFKIEHAIGLKDVLSSMGLSSVFTDKADMSGITDEKLFVSSAFHKAFVEVDEEGTEAAAATGLGIMALSLPPQVKADHPFLFFIRDNVSGVLLFSGKVMNPTM